MNNNDHAQKYDGRTVRKDINNLKKELFSTNLLEPNNYKKILSKLYKLEFRVTNQQQSTSITARSRNTAEVHLMLIFRLYDLAEGLYNDQYSQELKKLN